MSGHQARRAAADLLIRCLDERRTLDDALNNSPEFGTLEGPDRGFARAIASQTLRELGRIDAGLAPFLERPLDTATPPARALLRVGAAQSWLMETPDHAVVSETVAAAKSWPRANRAVGFLNAVLRKVVADRSGFDAAPLTANWPSWLWQKLSEGLGTGAATALLEAQMIPPDIHLTVKDSDAIDALAGEMDGEVLNAQTIRVQTGDVTALPGYQDGRWWVQDIAATLPANLTGTQPGETVFDICAAPGGKTLQLAAMGAQVMAVDRSRSRLRRLRENLKRTGLKPAVSVLEQDAETWRPGALADRILLDAPCSALGTLRRHPEGAWIKKQTDIERFPALQKRLLAASLNLLKPGGTLVYCVCSPLPEEGIDIVTAALETSEVERQPILVSEIPGFGPCLTSDGDVLTLPQASLSHDAFFMARLTRCEP